MRARIAEDTVDEPHGRLDHCHRGHFATDQHEVAEGNLFDADTPRDVVEDALVDSLVPPACEHEMLFAAVALRGFLPERNSRGRRDHEEGPIGTHLVEAGSPDLGFHHHARSATVRRIVDGAVHVVGPVTQIVNADLDRTLVDRLAQQRHSQRIEILGKDRDDIDAHGMGMNRIRTR
ncbi:Uncharacterised protein [Mycobacteroides abscessus subsp. abscessus]|nr:Uncharacterised protein [Mycobacteroides abscessus subsp. abscessus]